MTTAADPLLASTMEVATTVMDVLRPVDHHADVTLLLLHQPHHYFIIHISQALGTLQD